MSNTPFDTIVAPITGIQPAAVAWVRLSGPESWDIAARVFRAWPEEPISHRAVFGVYVHGDSGLALPFAKDHSYTGEQTVELSIHGSTASSRRLVEISLEAGARLAEPGEFTLRAFLNGRLDLTQAEAVRDTVDARTDAQLRAANLNRKGVLRREVSSIRNQVLKVLVQVEASVDFSEEIGELDHVAASSAVSKQIARIDHLLSTAEPGRILRNGYRIAIVGPPNAGKSSLLNALLGEDRSIVTEVPGTTRDYVEEQLEIAGFPVILIDTAGLRETDDLVESIGIQRTHAIAANADAVWYLYDSKTGWTDLDQSTIAAFDRPLTVLANKSDLAKSNVGMPVSAITRDGLDVLLKSLESEIATGAGEPLINLRHQPLLMQARESLSDCLISIDNHAPDDLLSVLLTDAAHHLGAVTGETASPDMIERIFHDFCVGK
jgi:tRNA modification GTPase